MEPVEIAAMRTRRGITQAELAKRVGVSQGNVTSWEAHRCDPRAALLPKIADVLDCSIDELFGRRSA